MLKVSFKIKFKQAFIHLTQKIIYIFVKILFESLSKFLKLSFASNGETNTSHSGLTRIYPQELKQSGCHVSNSMLQVADM